MSVTNDRSTDTLWEHPRPNRKSWNKKRSLVALAVVAALISFVAYSQYEAGSLIRFTSDMHGHQAYLFQELAGDKTNTWLSWNLVQGQTLNIDIINVANLQDDKIFAVKDAILSTETVEISDWLLHKGFPGDSSIYYKGWQGALDVASSHDTKFYIPQKFVVDDSGNGDGDITIILTNDKNPDGMSGFTKSVIDGNHILKTTITIYDARHLDAEHINTILRHEFGHALGLAHSTAPEDLMAPDIATEYPYISQCDIDALVGLYDGNKRSEVTCKK